MSVNSKMTAIADAVRDLRGMSGAMGLDAMATNINGAKTAVDSALTALSEKGVTVPAGTKVDGLAALIAAIEAGGGSGGGVASIDGYDVACGLLVPAQAISPAVVDTGWGEGPDETKDYGVMVMGWQKSTLDNASRVVWVVQVHNANINETINRYNTCGYASSSATSISTFKNQNFTINANYCNFNSDGTIGLSGYTTSWKFTAGMQYVWLAVKGK